MCFIRAHDRAEADWYGDHEARDDFHALEVRQGFRSDPQPSTEPVGSSLVPRSSRLRRRIPKPGNVYLAEAVGITGLYKIGKTIQPNKRFRGMSPVVTIIHIIPVSDMHWAETMLHNQFPALRIEGTEWFWLRQMDVDWICSLRSLEPDEE